MREIKFRGKRTHNGEWLYGFYGESYVNISDDTKNSYIIETKRRPKAYDIHKNTLGQFTGTADKNMHDIYEGDILSNGTSNYRIEFRNGAFRLVRHNMSCYTISDVDMLDFEIIGNIHDNPELLK